MELKLVRTVTLRLRVMPMLMSGPGTKVVKCIEGLHNKAFVLSLDNGTEIFAKLPNPNAGPPHFNTASEVATRHFVSALLVPTSHVCG